MALREEFESFGNWLFRWRSYLPLLFTGFFLIALITTPPSALRSNSLFEFFCLWISFLGLAIRMYTVGSAPRGTSGRNVMSQRADTLNQTGIYSLVRHPLYLGNFIIWLGISLFTGSWWFIILAIVIFWFYYEKIMFAEEEYLRRQFGQTYLDWAKHTSVFFPTTFAYWKPPQLRFKFKNALRREYSGFFAIVSVYSLMKVVKDSVAANQIVIDGTWLKLFISSLIIYLTLMFLKKKTKFLDVRRR